MNNSIEIQLSRHGTNLYIFFGGIAAGIAMPPFEFYNAAKIIDENKIFIRDFNQCWYQDGLPGVSEDIYSTATYIKSKIEMVNPDRVVLIGNSMGGYAAILFAKLIDADEAIAFAPQTFIAHHLRNKYQDNRWEQQINNMHKKCLHKQTISDLRSFLFTSGGQHKITVFVSKIDVLDNIHASYIKDIAGVTVHEFENCGHDVVKMLRDNGKLPAILSGTYT